MYSATELAQKYFRYFISASNGKGHGVHSPFVFDFIKFVKNDKKKYHCYKPIESIRKELLQDQRIIEVEDFGAGSTVIKTNNRIVYKMAQSSLKPRRFAQLLFRMVQYYKPPVMLELGTSFGITSAYIAKGNAAGKLYTLEGFPSIASIARNNFERLEIKNVQLIEGSFDKTLQPLLSSLQQIDFAFVDGNLKKEPTLHYFDELLKESTDKSILVFDDIQWSKEMEDAWELIKINDAVTLSIDLFFIGIIFLSRGPQQRPPRRELLEAAQAHEREFRSPEHPRTPTARKRPSRERREIRRSWPRERAEGGKDWRVVIVEIIINIEFEVNKP